MIIFVIILGWISGVIINYVSDVLPHRRRLVAPFCTNCEKPQPFFNYFLWPRKCPYCDHKRTFRSWIVEILTILAALWLWTQPNLVLGFWLSILVVIYFGTVVIIDLEHHLIMHPVSLVGSILGLIIGIQLHGVINTLLGGLAGFGAMLGLYLFGVLFARYVVRRNQAGFNDEALGFGDVILGGILGLFLGWPGILGALRYPWGIVYLDLVCRGNLINIFADFLVGKKISCVFFYTLRPFHDCGCCSLDLF
jgi:prepilin signal peptidase PulO-like enzyme (type II secretory pathway)